MTVAGVSFRLSFAACVTALAVSCTPNLPDIDDTISGNAQQAAYPELVSLPRLLRDAERPSKIEAEAQDLAARVARLKSRADALRGRTVIDGQTRLKLLEARRARGY